MNLINAKEKEKFKKMTFKEKVEHIREYYTFHIIGIIAIIFIIGSLLNSYVINPPKKIVGEIFIVSEYISFEKMDELTEKYKKDMPEYFTEETELDIDIVNMTNNDPDQYMAMQQKIVAMITAKEIDVMICTKDIFEPLAIKGGFLELDKVLTKEELDSLGDKVIKERVKTDEDEILPEGMYAIDITENKFYNDMIKGEKDIVVGIISNTERLEVAKKMFRNILEIY